MLDVIKSGDLERVVIVVLTFGVLSYLWITGRPIDDRLIDIALILLGYFFGAVITRKAVNNAHDG